MNRFDAIVIGGGIAGAGIAAELAGDGTVLLLEQESRPGMHTTGRSASVHSETYGGPVVRLLSRASRSHFLDSVDGQTFSTDRGCLYLSTAAQIDRLDAFARLPTVAPAVDRLDETEVRALLPILRPGVLVAALLERDARSLDVDAIHQNYLKRLRLAGGVIVCSAPVDRLTRDGSTWSVEAAGEVYQTNLVVNAAGAWGDVIADRAGVRRIGLSPLRRTAVLVDAPSGLDPRAWPMAVDIDEQFYLKPDSGRIVISPADETPMEPCDAWADEMDIAIAVDRVQQVVDLPVERVLHSWAGLRTFAPDRVPVAGYDPSTPGFFWLVGQGGYGIQTAPALSRLAAALARRDPLPADLTVIGLKPDDLSPARFQP